MDTGATHTFDAPIERVWAMFTDEASHVAKFVSRGNRDIVVVDCTKSDSTFRLELKRVVDFELPGFAKKVLSPTNTVVSIDNWNDDGDGTYSGHFTVETQGAPVDVKGTTHLEPNGDKTDYRVTVTLKVNVPLIGGKIEKWAKGDADKQLQEEFVAGDAWLAAHP
jgi:uncharacterized protein YndB with AHSA1/START domain